MAPGAIITVDGHRHPCLYRGGTLPYPSSLSKYPRGYGGSQPPPIKQLHALHARDPFESSPAKRGEFFTGFVNTGEGRGLLLRPGFVLLFLFLFRIEPKKPFLS